MIDLGGHGGTVVCSQGLILTGTPCQITLSDRKSLSMKNLDQLLASHIRELERFHFGPKPEVQLSNEEIQKLRYEFEITLPGQPSLGGLSHIAPETSARFSRLRYLS